MRKCPNLVHSTPDRYGDHPLYWIGLAVLTRNEELSSLLDFRGRACLLQLTGDGLPGRHMLDLNFGNATISRTR